MIELEETLTKITNIIDGYEGLNEDFSSPYFIQTMRDKLSAYAVHLGTFEAGFRKDNNSTEYTYKINKLTKRLEFRRGGMSIVDSEAEAEISAKGYYMEFLDAEEAYFKIRNIREQVNKVLDSMSSKLRILMSADGPT